MTPKETKIETYPVLLKRVRQAIDEGKIRAQNAVEREKVKTCWEIGRLILDHIFLHKDRAAYGKNMMIRLSHDLGMSETELKYMVEFARTYPILPAPGELSWAHIRELLAVNNAETRKVIADEAVQNRWSQKELRHEIKKHNQANSKTPVPISTEAPLNPVRGTFNTYEIVSLDGKQQIDLGFSNYLVLSSQNKGKFKEAPAGSKELFTYRAKAIEVTDGDTLWVLLDLGFGFTTKQHLRLRWIDTPEIVSKTGALAKRFVKRELKKASEITVTSTKSDKYDRYLADIWIGETYLNQKLIDQGHAVRVWE